MRLLRSWYLPLYFEFWSCDIILVLCFTFKGQWCWEDSNLEFSRLTKQYEHFWKVIFVVSAAICWTIHHILPDMGLINLCKRLNTRVSYVTCQRSIQIVVWNQRSLSFCLSSDACATSSHAPMLVWRFSHSFRGWERPLAVYLVMCTDLTSVCTWDHGQYSPIQTSCSVNKSYTVQWNNLKFNAICYNFLNTLRGFLSGRSTLWERSCQERWNILTRLHSFLTLGTFIVFVRTLDEDIFMIKVWTKHSGVWHFAVANLGTAPMWRLALAIHTEVRGFHWISLKLLILAHPTYRYYDYLP